MESPWRACASLVGKEVKAKFYVYFPATHSCKKPGVHDNFSQKVKALCASYDTDKGALTVLVSDSSCSYM